MRLFCITSSSMISHPSDFHKPSFIVGGLILPTLYEMVTILVLVSAQA